ncbi:MAG: cereblon family protein, partial [Gammaproteobacteria bacterium]|nr:cereblon family protein [Gammaproteobacteria bacterium]
RGTAVDRSPLLKDRARRENNSGQWIRCRHCGHVLASLADQIAVDGQRQSVHINPNGVSFRLEFYRRASGCLEVGPETAEHTWFAGHQWQVSVCAPCRAHVGWRFRAAGESRFHGLIVDRILHS